MIDWSPLRSALSRCRSNGMDLPIWWRDDDAIEPTLALDQLSEMSEKIGVPVHLAVIPKPAHDALVPFVKARPHLVPCVHGWTHLNTAPAGVKKSEFGVPRKDGELDLTRALDRMATLFGDDLLKMFVPPWNRMDASYHTALRDAGYAGFSTFEARSGTPVLPQINTHIDPIYWRGHRGLVDPAELVGQATAILNARIDGDQDPTEPFGLLTHHLVHVPEVWKFSATLMAEMLDGGAYPANLKEILT